MQKRILVDTNILIDFAEGRGYARRFFEDVKERYHEIFILKEVYVQTKSLTPKIHKIKGLIEELKSQDIYNKIETNEEEKEYSFKLRGICLNVVGVDLGEVDRRIIAVAKLRNLIIFSADENLKKSLKMKK